MKDKCNWQGIGTLVVITMCLVSILSPAMTQSSIPMLSNATDGETEGILKSTPVLSPTHSLTPPLKEQNLSPTSAPNQTQTHVPTPSLIPDPTPVLSHTPPPQEKNISLLNASNQTQTPTPSPTLGQDNTSTPTPDPSITPGLDGALTPTLTPTRSHAAPIITLYAPSSPVHDSTREPRTFTLSIDLPVNVSWLLNGTEVFNQSNVTESIYMNTRAKIGAWNVSAVATNANGTVMQTWIWNVSSQVTPTPTPGPTPSPSPMTNPASTPTPTPALLKIVSSNVKPSTPFYIYGWVHYENGSACDSPFVVITNLNTSEELIAENRAESNFYQLVTNLRFVNASEMLQIEASKNGVLVGNATYNVNQEDLDRGVVVVGINTGMPDLVISECFIPPLLVEDTNTINVTVCNNAISASAAFNVSLSVSKENETEYVTETRVVEGLQPGLFINISFPWKPHTEGIYNISIFADSNHEIQELNESNNNLTRSVFVGVPDFTVTNISFKPLSPIIEDVAEINATIANLGTDGEASVSVYDNKSINIERRPDDYLKGPINDTITLPDVLKIRVHFDFFVVPSDGHIKIYNESRLVEGIIGTGTDYWTKWCDGDTIRIESWNANFTVDRYEAMLLNESSISLDAKNVTNVYVNWNLSLQEIGWATSGVHNITVKVDPYNLVVESDEENNNKTEPICVNPSVDFAVTNISLNLSKPVLGDVVGLKANISNHGVRNGTTFVEVYYDNTTIEILKDVHRTIMSESEQYTSTDIISLPPDVLGARLYFESLRVFNGHVDICDKNGQVVERFYGMGNADDPISVWTGWVYSDNITVRTVLPYNPKMATHWCNFKIDKYEALIANETVTLNTSESKVINATWRTGAAYGGARDHNITVSVDPYNVFAENDETNNNLSEPVFVNGTDLAVTNIDIPYSLEDPLYRTKQVNITATIANLGAIDASNFTVNFSYGYGKGNTSGVVFNTTNISFLGAGNFTVITHWGIPETAELNFSTITVSIPFAPLIDNNKTNNVKYKTTILPVISLYDFSVENISVYPQEVRAGEPVNVTVTIGNLGIISGNVCVGFYVNHTDFVTGDERFRRIGTSEPVYVEPGRTNTLSFSWNANVHGGSHFIFAVADQDDEFEETSKTGDDTCNETHVSEGGTIYFKGDVCDTGNNVRNCTLHVIRPDLSLTNLSLDPAAPTSGDLVNITAKIKNENETEQANTTVLFYMQSNESISGCSMDSVSGERAWIWSSVLQPEDVPIRFHFDSIVIMRGGRVEAFINDSQGQRQPMCFYVKSEEAGGQLLKMPVIEYTTLGYTEGHIGLTTYYRQWNDVWTNWSVGTAVEIKAMAEGPGYIPYARVTPSIDKYQVRLGNKTITVNANESRAYNATWNTSFPLPPGKNYTVFATMENQTKSSDEIYLGGTDLAVTNISLKPVIWDGDLVLINATIANFGCMNARSFNVTFYEIYTPPAYSIVDEETRVPDDDHDEWIYTRQVEGLQTGNSTTISVPWNAHIRDIECNGTCQSPGLPIQKCSWTEYACDNYTINVTIEPLENHEQDNRTNNTLLREDVHVNRSRDFSATNLSFKVINESLSPDPYGKVYLALFDNVTANATVNITNLANQGGTVKISFYIDEHEIGNGSITFGTGNGTENAEIDWIADNRYGVYIPGDHNITVCVDPANEIYETNENESNNNFTCGIHVKAPELVIEKFSIYSQEKLGKGETATISVTIANRGRLYATDFNFIIYDWAERHIDNVAALEQYKGYPRIEVKRENATAMKLYLDLEIEEGGAVCITDSKGNEISCYDRNFHGWTPWMLENNITVETLKETTITEYLFNWDNIPGTDSEILRQFLIDDLGVDWAENATINKTGDNIHIFTSENNSVNLTIDVQSETAELELCDGRTLDLKVKEENGKLNIYKCESYDVYVYAQVSKVYYWAESAIIDTTTHDLAINETADISVEWPASTVGERLITAIIDPEDVIIEYNESNNVLAKHIAVQTADIEVSNMALRWPGGIEIGDDDMVRDNDTVQISATVTNIGIEEANNFDVRFLVDDIPIANETIPELASGSTIPVVANWTAVVGQHVIKVEADHANLIVETNETNNIAAKSKYVCGAEITGNTSWETLGLRGEILFEPTQPYDEDEVDITVNITNYGCMNATNFTMLLFYYHDNPLSWECEYHSNAHKDELVTYPNAEWIYIRMIDRANKDCTYRTWDPMDDVVVYDQEGNAVLDGANFNDTCRWSQLEEVKSCWIPVRGDMTNMSVHGGQNETFNITFYPVYQNETASLFSDINVPVNSSRIITVMRNVSVCNFTVMVVIDPDNSVPEDNKTNNIISRIMRVKPTREFMVTNVTVAKTNLSDLDTTNVTATVANSGLRNGTTGVRFMDYEDETRRYKYHFDKNLTESYLPIAPDPALLKPGYDNLAIIRRPGVDAIKTHFEWVSLSYSSGKGGRVQICDEDGTVLWERYATGSRVLGDDPANTPWVDGNTTYIYMLSGSEGDIADYELNGYTTKNELFYNENVTLNASKTRNESKIFTAMWTSYTGDHTINVTVDPDSIIDEINETNNTFILPLHVNASRDVTIENITFCPEYPADGDTVTITATVKNNGTKEATFGVDFWMNHTRDSTPAHVPNADVICEHEDVNRTSYISFLNRENVTLRPGANKSVNATYQDISVFGNPTYDIIAIVDPLDMIDEQNESDNELRKEIMMKYPEFITSFISPSREDKNASVSIKNAGAENATNVTVRFEVSEYEEIEEEGKKGYKELKKGGAANIRVHFKKLNTRNGWLEIKKLIRDEPGEPPEFELVKRYSGDIFNEWSPWIKGDSLWLFCYLEYEYIIDAWEWGEIVDVPPTNETRILNATESALVHIPSQWGADKRYDQPRKIKVTVDPYNNITEQKEDNNNRTGVMYIDLEANNLTFVSPQESMLCVLVEKNLIRATIKSNNETDGIVFPAGGEKRNFDVALEVRDLNGTVVYRHTGNSNAKSSSVDFEFPYADKTLYAGEEINVTFNIIGARIYPEFVGDTKDYKVSVIVDSENDINEANEFYLRGENEDSNVTSETVTVYHESGYTGGDLDTVSQGKIYGDMIYSIEGSGYDHDDVTFSDISSQIPDNATIRVARLYFHWLYWPEHVFADVDMQFNGVQVSPREYHDDTIATHFATRYGTYVYDVTAEVRDIVAHGGNYKARAEIYENQTHITGMGLLIVYESEDRPLIEYGIAEGTWLMMADNVEHPTGLLPEQCTANATFAGVVNTSKGKAELLTVLASWKVEQLRSGTTGDALLFNGREVGMLRGASYWKYEGDRCMALTTNRWEDVTDYLSTTENKAEIQSRGNFMMATNAFFKVTYLPDLTVTLNAPSSVKGGATRRIEATIRNLGESKAEDFVVEFKATDGTPSNEVRTVTLLEGNNETTIDFTWKAPDKVGALDLIKIQDVTISVEVDSGGNVEEFDENNNIGSNVISVTMTEKPLLLRGGGGGGGSGNGTGFGKGEVAEASTTSGVSGEAVKSPKTKGKTITGRLMKGIVAQSEAEGEEGGKRGEFSWVKLLIRLALLAVAVALVYVGYCYERRRHKYKNNEK